MKRIVKTNFNRDNDNYEPSKENAGIIGIDRIKVNFKKNVRHDYNELKELANSIKVNGQLQPIGIDGSDNLIYGFRRYKAMKEILNEKNIKYIRIEKIDNLEVIQLVENIQRDDLSDLEIANSLKKLKEDLRITNAQLANQLNKSEKWIEDKIKHYEIMQETISHAGEGEEIKKLKSIPTSLVNETRNIDSKKRASILLNSKNRQEIRDKIKNHAGVGNGSKRERIKKIEDQINKLELKIKELKQKIRIIKNG